VPSFRFALAACCQRWPTISDQVRNRLAAKPVAASQRLRAARRKYQKTAGQFSSWYRPRVNATKPRIVRQRAAARMVESQTRIAKLKKLAGNLHHTERVATMIIPHQFCRCFAIRSVLVCRQGSNHALELADCALTSPRPSSPSGWFGTPSCATSGSHCPR
jgi:hypothetical protein